MYYKRASYLILAIVFLLLVRKTDSYSYYLPLTHLFASMFLLAESLYGVFSERKFRTHLLVFTIGIIFATSIYTIYAPRLPGAVTAGLLVSTGSLWLIFRSHLQSKVKSIALICLFAMVPIVYQTAQMVDYSNKYLAQNLTFYILSLFGQGRGLLFANAKYIPNIFGALSLIGLCAGLFVRRYRAVVAGIVGSCIAYIVFLSVLITPSTPNIVYLLPLFPASLALVAIVIDVFLRQSLRAGFFVIFIVMSIFLFDTSSGFKVGEGYFETLMQYIKATILR